MPCRACLIFPCREPLTELRFTVTQGNTLLRPADVALPVGPTDIANAFRRNIIVADVETYNLESLRVRIAPLRERIGRSALDNVRGALQSAWGVQGRCRFALSVRCIESQKGKPEREMGTIVWNFLQMRTPCKERVE